MNEADVPVKSIWQDAPASFCITIGKPERVPDAEESLEFHAARLLLLISVCGGPRTKRIEGRTKLAKLDFLVRYPHYLARAARIKGEDSSKCSGEAEMESPMIRYRYGPWDDRYYNVFAYLVGKGLIDIQTGRRKEDVFHLTKRGEAAAKELMCPEFEEVIERCRLAYTLFGTAAGSTIKDFIYKNFTEIADKPLRATIEGGCRGPSRE